MKNKKTKKSIRLEFYLPDKKKLTELAEKKNIPLKNMLENYCIELIEKNG